MEHLNHSPQVGEVILRVDTLLALTMRSMPAAQLRSLFGK